MPNPISKLTPCQRQVWQALKAYVRDWGRPPTVRELAASLGGAHAGNLQRQLDALRDKGYIHRPPGRARNIVMRRPALGDAQLGWELVELGGFYVVPDPDGRWRVLRHPGAVDTGIVSGSPLRGVLRAANRHNASLLAAEKSGRNTQGTGESAPSAVAGLPISTLLQAPDRPHADL